MEALNGSEMTISRRDVFEQQQMKPWDHVFRILERRTAASRGVAWPAKYIDQLGMTMLMVMLEVPDKLVHSPRLKERRERDTLLDLLPRQWTNAAVDWLFNRLPLEQTLQCATALGSSYSPLGLRFSTIMSLRLNSYHEILPLLQTAPRLSAASFVPRDRMDVAKPGSFKIVNAQQHHTRLASLVHAHAKGVEQPGERREALDALVHDLLPHVLQGTGRTLDDCLFFDCFMEGGAFYPSLHWDNNWNQCAHILRTCTASRHEWPPW